MAREEASGRGMGDGPVPLWLKVVIAAIVLWMAYYLATNISP